MLVKMIVSLLVNTTSLRSYCRSSIFTTIPFPLRSPKIDVHVGFVGVFEIGLIRFLLAIRSLSSTPCGRSTHMMSVVSYFWFWFYVELIPLFRVSILFVSKYFHIFSRFSFLFLTMIFRYFF